MHFKKKKNKKASPLTSSSTELGRSWLPVPQKSEDSSPPWMITRGSARTAQRRGWCWGGQAGRPCNRLRGPYDPVKTLLICGFISLLMPLYWFVLKKTLENISPALEQRPSTAICLSKEKKLNISCQGEYFTEVRVRFCMQTRNIQTFTECNWPWL